MFDGITNEKKIGEVTPDYIYSAVAPERIKEHFPDVKLILTVRNPVERIYSMYWILRGKYENDNQYTFEEKLESTPNLINQGFFINYIENYLKTFNKEQLLVLTFEELKNSPTTFLKKIYDFIGVDNEFESPYLKTKINRATFRKHYSKSKLLYLVWRFFKKFNLNGLAYKIEKINSKDTPPMNPETRKKLVEIYKPYNQRLSSFLNQDFSHWDN